MFTWLLKNKFSVLGICVGAIVGFVYWKMVGCSTGNCSITSKPLNSTLYGSLMGYLLFNIFQKK